MGPGFFVIAILGCADGSAACAPVATIPTRYESRDACVAATGPALAANNDFDFPTLARPMPAGQGTCRRTDAGQQRPQRLAPGLNWPEATTPKLGKFPNNSHSSR